ncbi:hypothetical protein DXG01_002710 [Tephrocybe rancida]|nr:hypothetical protein DXG01_002710 [Tephrocybe rancida]
MISLTDKIHALGLDAKLFQDWGFDLLKYDNCAVPFDSIIKQGIVGIFANGKCYCRPRKKVKATSDSVLTLRMGKGTTMAVGKTLRTVMEGE